MRRIRILPLFLALLTLVSCKSVSYEKLMPPAAEQAALVIPDTLIQMVKGMDDRTLIGQMVMVGFDGTSAPSQNIIHLLKDYKAGNVILFGWNMQTFAQTKSLVSQLNAYNPLPQLPMFIASDVEGGLVSRLPWNPQVYSAYYMGKKGDADAVYAQFKRVGEGLHAIGITVDLAPVMDIAKNTNNSFLANELRMYGSDAALVSKLCASAVRGLKDGGTLAFGKHFPGHDDTAIDPHNALPVLNATLSQWDGYDRKPFDASIAAGLDGMLVGHILYANIDSNVASLSRFFITDMLRGQMHFQGVIMSDDMRMRAVLTQCGVGEAAVRFVEAGGDLVLIGRYIDKQEDVFNALYNALKSGRLTRTRLEQSVLRILAKKLSLR